MSKTWRELRPENQSYRRVKIIGLHEDVGYSGAWCKDVSLYSRVLLVEDLVTKQQFLVTRPEELWVNTPYSTDGVFHMNHNVYVDISTCDERKLLPEQIDLAEGAAAACPGLEVNSSSSTGEEKTIVIDTWASGLEGCKSGELQIKFQAINIPDWVKVLYSDEGSGSTTTTNAPGQGTTTTNAPGQGTTTTTSAPDTDLTNGCTIIWYNNGVPQTGTITGFPVIGEEI